MWEEINNSLVKTFEFTSFKEAVEFVNKVADLAEAQNHHPEITLDYKLVTTSLMTHSAGGTITDKDRLLADAIDAL